MPFHRHAALRVLLFTGTLALTACVLTDPITEPFVGDRAVTRERTYSFPRGLLAKVAVMPFYPSFVQSDRHNARAVAPSDAGLIVARFVTEELLRSDVRAIAPSDLDSAFNSQGVPAPRLDGPEVARLAARDFGATAVLLGEVKRYRERSGNVPSSVAFELTLYKAPGGEKAWTSHFDETQRPLSENIVNARRYPGGGSRWLSAGELARWGSESAIQALTARR